VAAWLDTQPSKGVKGIGVATAMEIISLFGSLDEFKAWWQCISEDGADEEDDPSDPHTEVKKRLVRLSPGPPFRY